MCADATLTVVFFLIGLAACFWCSAMSLTDWKYRIIIKNILFVLAIILFLVGVTWPWLKEVFPPQVIIDIASNPIAWFILLIFCLLLLTRVIYLPQRNSNRSVKIIKDEERNHYLIEGNICSHIPDPPTFDYLGGYFGFSWGDAKLMLLADIKKKYVMGKRLPSIKLYFPVQNITK